MKVSMMIAIPLIPSQVSLGCSYVCLLVLSSKTELMFDSFCWICQFINLLEVFG